MGEDFPDAQLMADEGTPDANWREIELRHADGDIIAAVERNSVDSDPVAVAEIRRFLDEIADARPANAVRWLSEFLPTVRTIYAFQVLSGTESGNGWEALSHLQSIIWNAGTGIFQADVEGFSNLDGYYILWQFAADVQGQRQMAVLDHDDTWLTFGMDLGNRAHREAFLQGRVPDGIVATPSGPTGR